MRPFKIYKKCKERGSVFSITLIKYYWYKIKYKKNIVAHHNTTIVGVKNIVSNHNLEIGMGKIGFSHKNDITLLNIQGELKLKGNYSIGRGCRIDIAEKAAITIGSGGYINVNSNFIIMNGLTIGDNTIISWNCEFLDDDFHEINYEGKKESDKKIIIGSNVWIGSGVKIYQGTVIPNGSVVAANSVVRGVFNEEKILIAGFPAKKIKENINWR